MPFLLSPGHEGVAVAPGVPPLPSIRRRKTTLTRMPHLSVASLSTSLLSLLLTTWARASGLNLMARTLLG